MVTWLRLIKIISLIAIMICGILFILLVMNISFDGSGFRSLVPYQKAILSCVIMVSFLFSLLVAPICNYLEKKLKD
jgi:hypothetical protein